MAPDSRRTSLGSHLGSSGCVTRNRFKSRAAGKDASLLASLLVLGHTGPEAARNRSRRCSSVAGVNGGNGRNNICKSVSFHLGMSWIMIQTQTPT